VTLLSRSNLGLEAVISFLDGPHKMKTSKEDDDINKEA
jgi:hypothetical protein